MSINLATAIADDCDMFDGIQTVTLTQASVATSVAEVTKSPLSKRQVEMVGGVVALEGTERSFSLPVANLGGVSPKQGSTITDASSVVWMIVAAELATLDTRWKCACQKQK